MKNQSKNTKLLFLCILLTISQVSFTQQAFKGMVIDGKNKQPLSFVNIGIIEKDEGTVSNEKGEFIISLDKQFDNDTVRFSMIGYKSLNFSVKEFRTIYKNNPVIMETEIYNISEVEVVSKKSKKDILGNHLRCGYEGSYGNDKLGHELGILAEIKKKPALIQDFNFFLSSKDCDTVSFRLNIYDAKDGKPGSKILNENVIIKVIDKKGVVKVDLSKYNLVVENDFIASLEWIHTYEKGCVNFRFRHGFGTSPIFARKTSQSSWKQGKSVGMEFFITVKYM